MVGLAPEMVHKVALSGWLNVEEVGALAQTCKRMASILVWDGYGRDLHMALRGVMENVREKNWVSARYAASRGWVEEEGVDGVDGVWRKMVESVTEKWKTKMWTLYTLEGEEDVEGWENVVLACLSRVEGGYGGCLGVWDMGEGGERNTPTSLLHGAACVGSQKLVDWVVERGGELEILNRWGGTPLFVACVNGKLGVVEKLVEMGGDVGVKNRKGENVLLMATKLERLDVIEFVLRLEPGLRGDLDVDAKDRNGTNALTMACMQGSLGPARLLVDVGNANVDVEGLEGKASPLVVACGANESADLVAFLVERGAGERVEKNTGVWAHALDAAISGENVDVVRVLMVQAGVDVNDVVLTANGTTPLYLACEYGHLELAKVLVEEGGVDVNAVGCYGETALFAACWMGRPDVVEWLVEEGGADVEVVNEDGLHAVDVARGEGRDEVVSLFEERGWGVCG